MFAVAPRRGDGKWDPDASQLRFGRTLTRSEAWINLFHAQWLELAGGEANNKDVLEAALHLYPSHGDQDPAEVARGFYGPA
jgi:hypothetical protein